jgi:hypothetical protein
VCYKEAQKKKQQPPNAAPSSEGIGGGSAASFGSTVGPRTVPVALSSTDSALHPTSVTVPTPAATTDKKDDADGEGVVGGREGRDNNAESSMSSVNGDKFDGKDSDKERKKEKKNRCAVCRKKVGLTGVECRCGGLFCAVHRYSDRHSCTFDYRQMAAQEIRRNNPVIVIEKIREI